MSLRPSPLLLAVAMIVMAIEPQAAGAQTPLQPHQQLARSIYKELVEIDTTTATGDTARAADAMAARLRAAGFSKEDIKVFKPAPRKGNLVARLQGTGARRPILLVAHTDVVGARREDWSTDPFKLVEQDGYFYARGSNDDKFMAASWVANLIRLRQEGFRPDRDLVVVLETDEEILDRNGVGTKWLMQQQRSLLDAEFALNEGGIVGAVKGQPAFVAVQIAEKIPANFILEVRNPGGHSSQPRRDNAIYQLAGALQKLAQFQFPVVLTETTRGTMEAGSALYPPSIANDMKAIAAGSNDAEIFARLSNDPLLNAVLRTTCVATILEGAGTFNALPQHVRATVNCRIMQEQTPEETLATLRRVIADDQVSITLDWAHVPSPPSLPNAEILDAIAKAGAETWRPLPVLPVLVPGGTDSSWLRNAGIPSYGIGPLNDLADVRDHGRDERIYVKAFYDGHEFLYRLIKRLSTPNDKAP